jgi:hypothetical protein
VTEYSSAIDLAARLIIKKGREVIFRHLETDTTTVNPDRPWDKPAPLKGDQKLKMVFLDYEQKRIDGTAIKTNDKQVLMFAKGVKYEPTTKDKIIDLPKDGGKLWNIVNVEIVKPGEEAVMYILQVRR